jgi:hypothetical protein
VISVAEIKMPDGAIIYLHEQNQARLSKSDYLKHLLDNSQTYGKYTSLGADYTQALLDMDPRLRDSLGSGLLDDYLPDFAKKVKSVSEDARFVSDYHKAYLTGQALDDSKYASDLVKNRAPLAAEIVAPYKVGDSVIDTRGLGPRKGVITEIGDLTTQEGRRHPIRGIFQRHDGVFYEQLLGNQNLPDPSQLKHDNTGSSLTQADIEPAKQKFDAERAAQKAEHDRIMAESQARMAKEDADLKAAQQEARRREIQEWNEKENAPARKEFQEHIETEKRIKAERKAKILAERDRRLERAAEQEAKSQAVAEPVESVQQAPKTSKVEEAFNIDTPEPAPQVESNNAVNPVDQAQPAPSKPPVFSSSDEDLLNEFNAGASSPQRSGAQLIDQPDDSAVEAAFASRKTATGATQSEVQSNNPVNPVNGSKSGGKRSKRQDTPPPNNKRRDKKNKGGGKKNQPPTTTSSQDTAPRPTSKTVRAEDVGKKTTTEQTKEQIEKQTQQQAEQQVEQQAQQQAELEARRKAEEEAKQQADAQAKQQTEQQVQQETAQETAQQTSEDAVENATEQASQEAAKEVVQETAEQAGQKTTQEVVQEAAEQAGKKTTESAAEAAMKRGAGKAGQELGQDAVEDAAQKGLFIRAGEWISKHPVKTGLIGAGTIAAVALFGSAARRKEDRMQNSYYGRPVNPM